jgi:hypothetical protein
MQMFSAQEKNVKIHVIVMVAMIFVILKKIVNHKMIVIALPQKLQEKLL